MNPDLFKSLLATNGIDFKEKPKPRPIMVYNKKTGKYATYSTAYYFINKNELSNRVVLGRLNKGEITPSGNWFYTYYDPNNPYEAELRLWNAVMDDLRGIKPRK